MFKSFYFVEKQKKEEYGPFGDPTQMLFQHSDNMVAFISARSQV